MYIMKQEREIQCEIRIPKMERTKNLKRIHIHTLFCNPELNTLNAY